ncbi:unnamed protein product [Didymodactylos carnosus]|uniref:OTU domain-containing protein n=1 Tax=Didymodactylos carnosus TaxID=1234261 RepID=A0A815F6R5_9BILA|nr:unnamed protein product [Didymodactylos carnosus]CAF4168469.1 unnamed protein product [Didymodactylos carnosus]
MIRSNEYSVDESGKGNCLVDACLLTMIGIQDSPLTLRKHLSDYIKSNEIALRDRWKYARISSDQKLELGIDLDDNLLDQEWKAIVTEAKVTNDGKCTFLQSCHIFAISNMIKRPIVVLGEEYVDTVNEKQAQFNDIIGIYLPLLFMANNTLHYPIVLGYAATHFTALVTSKSSTLSPLLYCGVPLSCVSSSSFSFQSLSVHYINYVEQMSVPRLLAKYLVIEEIKLPEGQMMKCCALNEQTLSEDINVLNKYIKYLEANLPNEEPLPPDNLSEAHGMETDVGTNNDCLFKVGDVFSSFNEFKYKINDYSINTGGMFSIGHSTKLKQTSGLVYGKLLYVCCDGGKQRCRSKGIRPQQYYMSLNCPAKIRFFNTGTQLKISILNFHHNHKLDTSNLKYYPRNRRLENETVELIKKFDNHKVPRAIIRDIVMSENKTKFTTVEDIANVLNKVTTNNIPSQSIAVQKILNEIKV